MAKTRWKVTGGAVAGVVALGALLIAGNPAPQVPLIAPGERSASTQPYVIKLHARWCPVCMVTRDVWSAVQEAYTGRVKLVVFDFTTDATTAASKLTAQRLGLDGVFDEYFGETGTVLVVDGHSKEVRRALHGTRELAEYRAAIDAATAATHD